ncbi:MAG: ribosome small subunit-dependent GTPase A [Gammaproteobacteria bacterium]|nr:ribosome small subunit-dependent GTPase A [Gammaproteobacteria bacterium]
MKSIGNYGWTQDLAQEITKEELDAGHVPARVVAEHRQGIVVHDGNEEHFLPNLGRWLHGAREERPLVGDWVLLTEPYPHVQRLLSRRNALQRGSKDMSKAQNIAANVDIVFPVFSCNDDFNESRLERYLALAEIANAESKILLTKTDIYPEYGLFLERAKKVAGDTQVLAVNAHVRSQLRDIAESLPPTRTGIFVGSSGVGKSTLVNTLAQTHLQLTKEVRESDSKGRHATVSRSLFRLPFGGLVVDVPGTRELVPAMRVNELPRTFPEIEEWIRQCQFSNCSHVSEPGCKILEAFENGELDQRRFRNYQMLVI